MATAAVPDHEVTDTECSICSEYFTKPKLLPCAHTLCRHCLLSWLGAKPQGFCPICSRAIADPKEQGLNGWEGVVDALPTDLAMEALVDSTRLLSKGHACGGCLNNAAVSVCLNCRDLLCQTCANCHKNLSLTRKHKVESLTSLTPERLASSQPAPCSADDDKLAELFCPNHNAAICHLCASSKHRACPEVTLFEHRVDGLRAEVADMAKKLRSAEKEHDIAIKNLDRKLLEMEKLRQTNMTNIDADCDSLENEVKECRRRLKQETALEADKAKDKVQQVKGSLIEQKGGLTSHRVSVERIQRAMPAKFLNEVNQTLVAQAKDLRFDTKLPEEVRASPTELQVLDQNELKHILEKLKNLSFKEGPAVASVSAQDNPPEDGQAATTSDNMMAGNDKCVFCCEVLQNPKSLNCGHLFCKPCVDTLLSVKAVCPCCNNTQRIIIGTQPLNGKMSMQNSTFDIGGYKDKGSLVITYQFPSGIQGAEHPNPDQPYYSCRRTAYLPNTEDGRKVLMLLKTAFDRRLIFSIGRLTTNPNHMGIIWSDIHHKTSMHGGKAHDGFPDPTYLRRVTEELAASGVTEQDLTAKQKDFIINPANYCEFSGLDFSEHFDTA